MMGILFSSYISKTREKINIETAVRKQSSLGMKRKSQQGEKVMCVLTMFSAITRLENKHKATLALKVSLRCSV